MHNEAEAMDLFFERVEPILEGIGIDYEIVCVNDGSRDTTLQQLLAHRERNPRICVIDLTRNFGKDTALTAGLDHARGAAVIPMDADLQDPPEIVPQMVEKWREGWDVVYGKRVDRASDTAMKRLTAGWFYRFFNMISEIAIPENTGDFRLMDRRVINTVRLLGERNRFMKGLFAWVGFRQTAVEYVRESRSAGTTKWNYLKLWNFALGGIIAFTTVPLRVWSYVGLSISLSAFVYAFFLITRTFFMGVDVPGYASIMVVTLCLGGLQLFSLGIIGEYLARVYVEVKGRPLYLVRDCFGVEGSSTRR
jgi:glycosyltransferase involved in cell wall biosynthesis